MVVMLLSSRGTRLMDVPESLTVVRIPERPATLPLYYPTGDLPPVRKIEYATREFVRCDAVTFVERES